MPVEPLPESTDLVKFHEYNVGDDHVHEVYLRRPSEVAIMAMELWEHGHVLEAAMDAMEGVTFLVIDTRGVFPVLVMRWKMEPTDAIDDVVDWVIGRAYLQQTRHFTRH